MGVSCYEEYKRLKKEYENNTKKLNLLEETIEMNNINLRNQKKKEDNLNKAINNLNREINGYKEINENLNSQIKREKNLNQEKTRTLNNYINNAEREAERYKNEIKAFEKKYNKIQDDKITRNDN